MTETMTIEEVRERVLMAVLDKALPMTPMETVIRQADLAVSYVLEGLPDAPGS